MNNNDFEQKMMNWCKIIVLDSITSWLMHWENCADISYKWKLNFGSGFRSRDYDY